MPPLASFLGLRSWTLIFFLPFFAAILFSFRVGLYCVSGAEEQLPACNVLIWDPVIQTNHFFFLALWPLTSLLSGWRIFFIVRNVYGVRVRLFVVVGGHRSCLDLVPSRRMWFQVGRKNDMFGQNHWAVAKQRHGADCVAQLAQVSRPLMTKQFFHGLGMNSRNIFTFF